jgi:hypothetical protein
MPHDRKWTCKRHLRHPRSRSACARFLPICPIDQPIHVATGPLACSPTFSRSIIAGRRHPIRTFCKMTIQIGEVFTCATRSQADWPSSKCQRMARLSIPARGSTKVRRGARRLLIWFRFGADDRRARLRKRSTREAGGGRGSEALF